MYNKGLEASINGLIIRKENFSWNSSLNLSYNKNEITSLAPGVKSLLFNDVGGSSGQVSISLPGNPVGMIYAIRTDGVDAATGRRIFIDSKDRKVFYQQVPKAGSYQWEYADGTRAPAVNTTQDGVVYKNTNPKFYGGLSNNFRFKNFDLEAMFTFQTGGNMYYATQSSLMDYRFQNNSVKILGRWQKPGDVTDVPRVQDGDITSWGYSIPITANVYKSDFVRLKNVTLGYALPKNLMNKIKTESARVYVSGQNLWLLTNYPGSDPEVTSTGNSSATQGFDNLNPTRGGLSYMMTVDPATSDVSAVWEQGYQIINACNVFLSNMDTKGGTVVGPTLNKTYTAEARFLRGMAYYYMLQLYALLKPLLALLFNYKVTLVQFLNLLLLQTSPFSLCLSQALMCLELL